MNIKFSSIIIALLLLTGCAFSQQLDLSLPIRQVKFTGLTHIKSQDLFRLAPSIRLKIGNIWTSGEVSYALSELYATGYFSQIDATTTTHGSMATLVIAVKENPYITTVGFKGNTKLSTGTLLPLLKSVPFNVMNYKDIEHDRLRLEAFFTQSGYDFMRIDAITATDNQLTFVISEGYISDISIYGLKTIEPTVVYREFGCNPGDVFNSKQLREDREKIVRMGYFSDVSSLKLAKTSTLNNRVSVALAFRERKNNLIDIGIEQEQSQVVFFLRNDWHHVFLNSDLLTGKVQFGNNTDSNFKITSYSLRYSQPWLLNMFPVGLDLSVWEEFQREFVGQDPTTQTLVDTKRRGQQIGFSFPIQSNHLMFQTRFKNEDVSPLITAGPIQPYSLRSATFQLRYQDTLSLNNPKNGYQWSTEYEKGGNIWGLEMGGLNYNRFSLDGSHYIGVTDQDTVAMHGFFGTFSATNQSISTFENETFILGGPNSLRGYKEIDPLVGEQKWVVNLELRHDFNEWLQGILFYDFGKIGRQLDPLLDTSALYTGKGVGVRFFTPIAPIRFDFGWGDNRGLIIYFGLGQVF